MGFSFMPDFNSDNSFWDPGGHFNSKEEEEAAAAAAAPRTQNTSWFEDIDLDALAKKAPWLMDKIQKYKAGKGTLGPNYQFQLSNLAKAFAAKPMYSDNDITNTLKTTIQNPMAAQAFGMKDRMKTAAALGGSIDSGGYHAFEAGKLGEIDSAANAAMLQKSADMYGENAQVYDNRLQDAINSFWQWSQNNRGKRMGNAGFNNILAGMQGGPGAGIWPIVGAASSIAGSYLGAKK